MENEQHMSQWVHGYRCRQTVRAGLYKWLYAFLGFVDHALTAWIQGFPGIDVTTDLKEHDSRTSDAPRDSVRQMLTERTPRQPPDCGHETMYEVSSGEGSRLHWHERRQTQLITQGVDGACNVSRNET